MIRLDTLRALHEHEHQLAAYCATCERWAVLDLERLIAEGRGDYVLRRSEAALQLLEHAHAIPACGALQSAP